MAKSLNPSSSLAYHISRLKGDPVAVVINSTSLSFMFVIVRRRSLIGISLGFPMAASGCLLYAINCWDCFWSRLLFSVSLRSTSWPNLLKMLLELLLSPFWLRRTLSVRLLAPTELACRSVRPQPLGLHLSAGSLQPSGFHSLAVFVRPSGFYLYATPLGLSGFHLSTGGGCTLPTHRLIPYRTG